MHYVHQIRDFKEKSLDFFPMRIAAINRKQVPLCAYHSKALHSNSLSSAKHKLFEGRR